MLTAAAVTIGVVSMADWKQITARIRRARTGKDPAGQLSNLYQKTRDAMVAFELAKHLESSGQSSEAAKWYSTAAERFRRAEWKTKAQEAAVRLSGALPGGHDVAELESAVPNSGRRDLETHNADVAPGIVVPEPAAPFVETVAAYETIVAPEAAAPQSSTSAAMPGETKRRHRGRRGGRSRRRSNTQPASPSHSSEARPATFHRQPPPPVDEAPESRFTRVSESLSPAPAVPESVEGAHPVRARFGDPGLSSRLTLLEMQFRRLLSCPPLKLDEPDRAPAGPGVLLLSDSELTTHYYVEDCQTLRIGIANLLRGTSHRRSAVALKAELAEHLGIAESRVAKYLTEHCVVRYLQLDEGAPYFAHFVIAVLNPVLND